VNHDRTILVVEDDPSDQFFIVEAFRLSGARNPIQIVSNAQEAIAYLKGEGRFADRTQFAYPTFVLTDLKMPGSDGFALLRHLREHPEPALVAPVVLTASRDKDDVQRAYSLGAGLYLQKPSSFLELQERLRILHSCWMLCEIPEVGVGGSRAFRQRLGKLGESLNG